MSSNISFAVIVTGPIFFIVVLGIFLKRIRWVNDEFAAVGSKIVFNLALPSLLFVNLAETKLDELLPLRLIAYAVFSITLLFVVLHFGSRLWFDQKEDRGTFVQGSFRSNMGIIGLAYCVNAYGDAGLVMASIYLAVLTVYYNILATITLTHHSSKNDGFSPRILLFSIFSNPLIIAILAALIFSYCQIVIPSVILDTGKYFASMTLPLALLCAGASIRWNEFRASAALYWSTFTKLILMPMGLTVAAILFGFRGMELGVFYLMVAAPTSAASYPMVRELGGNHYLAAAIIAATTLGSIITTTLGIVILHPLGSF